MNEDTRTRLEAILGPISDDDALVEKVRALDKMLTRYMREALERAEQDEIAATPGTDLAVAHEYDCPTRLGSVHCSCPGGRGLTSPLEEEP